MGVSRAWPFSYDDLEPFYTSMEQLLQVHGQTGDAERLEREHATDGRKVVAAEARPDTRRPNRPAGDRALYEPSGVGVMVAGIGPSGRTVSPKTGEAGVAWKEGEKAGSRCSRSTVISRMANCAPRHARAPRPKG